VTRWFAGPGLMIFPSLHVIFASWRKGSLCSQKDKPFGLQPRRVSSGFTLLEVLVALIVLALSFGVTFQALSQSGRVAWKADRYEEAARIAQNLLADTQWVREAIRDKDRKGELKGEDGWHYTVAVEPLSLKVNEDEEPVEVPSMLSLRLCLSYGNARDKKSYCLTRWYREGLIGTE
jgi:prepilin-type N-terminal cleavage/methylation domain-containing protein